MRDKNRFILPRPDPFSVKKKIPKTKQKELRMNFPKHTLSGETEISERLFLLRRHDAKDYFCVQDQQLHWTDKSLNLDHGLWEYTTDSVLSCSRLTDRWELRGALGSEIEEHCCCYLLLIYNQSFYSKLRHFPDYYIRYYSKSNMMKIQNAQSLICKMIFASKLFAFKHKSQCLSTAVINTYTWRGQWDLGASDWATAPRAALML